MVKKKETPATTPAVETPATTPETKKTILPQATPEDQKAQFTDNQQQFLELIQQYSWPSTTRPETIADYIGSRGEGVLEDPAKLSVVLAELSVNPARRSQIINHWFGKKGIAIPPEVLQTVRLPPEIRDKIQQEEADKIARAREKYVYDTETKVVRLAKEGERGGTMEEAKDLKRMADSDEEKKAEKVAASTKQPPTTYIYDTETKVIRFAKEGERGATMEEAKELKRMADSDEEKKGGGKTESAFIPGADGKWAINPNAKLTSQDMMTWFVIEKAQNAGKPIDPMEAEVAAAERFKVLREAFGGDKQALPAWMTDPLAFMQAMQTFGGGAKPDEGVKQELAQVRQTLVEMREQRYQEMFQAQQQQFKDLSDKLTKFAEENTKLREESKKTVVGMTEIDLMGRVLTETKDLLGRELPGLRGDIRYMVTEHGRVPPRKTPEQREQRIKEMGAAVDKDESIERLGREIFYPEQEGK